MSGVVLQKYLDKCQPYIDRWRACQLRERARRVAEARRASQAVTRFLPMTPAHINPAAPSAPGAIHGHPDGLHTASTSMNYNVLMAQEARYALGLEQRPVDLLPFDMCPTCRVAMRYSPTQQQLVCGTCKHWKRFADMTSHALAFGEEIEFTKYTYKPMSHLEDTMRSTEGSESHVVPYEQLWQIMYECARRHLQPEDLTIGIIRDICDHLKSVKVENAVQCYCRLTGRAPRRMTPYMKEQMRLMFHAQEAPFRKHCEKRVNNLSFSYILYKYCELLGYWEMLESMPLLRGTLNLSSHDTIFSKVCKELDWQYIPTVTLTA